MKKLIHLKLDSLNNFIFKKVILSFKMKKNLKIKIVIYNNLFLHNKHPHPHPRRGMSIVGKMQNR